ncbi:MAG: F-type H+-transporting ATPase subunit delta [Pyrinomonadaceae bacterium]|nr:F-type H+-transporting ATPase subunit delta [Pyrinomonadaceae bacterium]
MSSQTVARRYAAALADVIVPTSERETVQQELAYWANLLEANPPLLEAFSNPTVAHEQKEHVLSELIARTKVARTTANFLRVLLRNQRLAELPQINAKLVEVLNERSGLVSATVTSARPVPNSTRIDLEEKLRQLTGKNVRLTFETDEALIGGMVTRIGSTIYDGSVRSQLQRLGEKLAG